MNPLTNVRNITKLNEREISLGVSDASSWHEQYKDSAWIFIGGLDFQLTEGDILCVFSQYGEIVNVNLVRDKKTGKSKGYCFLCYEDQRSTNLAVDNFNGIKITGRTIRVDHVSNYRIPKEDKSADLETKLLRDVGCAPQVQRQLDSIIEREQAEAKQLADKMKEEPDWSTNTSGNRLVERRLEDGDKRKEQNERNKEKESKSKHSRSSRTRRSRSPNHRRRNSSSTSDEEEKERRYDRKRDKPSDYDRRKRKTLTER